MAHTITAATGPNAAPIAHGNANGIVQERATTTPVAKPYIKPPKRCCQGASNPYHRSARANGIHPGPATNPTYVVAMNSLDPSRRSPSKIVSNQPIAKEISPHTKGLNATAIRTRMDDDRSTIFDMTSSVPITFRRSAMRFDSRLRLAAVGVSIQDSEYRLKRMDKKLGAILQASKSNEYFEFTLKLQNRFSVGRLPASRPATVSTALLLSAGRRFFLPGNRRRLGLAGN